MTRVRPANLNGSVARNFDDSQLAKTRVQPAS
jgi:hypothetical protein